MARQDDDFQNMQNDPKNWKWGLYVNPEDSRILVPKRIPAMGLTLNFGNPKTGLFLLLCAVVITLTHTLVRLWQGSV
jgi:uncharacterized membrane protein